MSLLRGVNLTIDFGHGALLDKANFVIHKGQHIGLLGRNGEGKSTFLKLLSNQIRADSGDLQKTDGLKVSYLSQDVPERDDCGVFEVVAKGLGDIASVLMRYQDISHQSELNTDELHRLHQQIDDAKAWGLLSQVEAAIDKMGLPAESTMGELSGGMRRRVLLAQTLLSQPDVLLLDEPTNHLDIDAINWLEALLNEFKGTFIVVTHDRAFLQRVAKQIIDIDRGRLTFYDGDYPFYLKQKELFLLSEERENSRFDKNLAKEEVWIRQGIKARRTRNEGRVRALKAMRVERQKRREQKGTLSLGDSKVKLTGRVVFEANNLSYDIDGKSLINDFSTLVLRGEKIGIVGPNGCGKTTLLKLLLGKLTPNHGEVKQGTELSVAYFDQLREQLDGKQTVMDVVGQGSQTVNIFGKDKHIISYLGEFLFSPDRCHSPVSYLSGGEKNRLLLARLFTRNANVFIFDEPTNDLDIESLEMLEAFLVDYPGTLLIVSHDREFLDNVVSGTWLYEGDGRFNDYVGGYSDAMAHSKPRVATVKEKSKPIKSELVHALSMDEKRELKGLPKKIDKLEADIEVIEAELAQPGLYENGQEKALQELTDKREKKSNTLQALYDRWQELEEK